MTDMTLTDMTLCAGHRHGGHGHVVERKCGLGLFVLLEHQLLELLGHSRTERIDIFGPHGGTEVHEDNPGWDGDCNDPGCTDRNPLRVEGLSVLVKNRVSIAIGRLSLPGLTSNTIETPAEHSAEESAVNEIDCETLLSKPEKEAAGKELLGGW